MFHASPFPCRPPASLSPLTSMLSAITSSLESFIRSSGRCAGLLLPVPCPSARVPGASDLGHGKHLPGDSSPGTPGLPEVPLPAFLGEWGMAPELDDLCPLRACPSPRPPRKNSSAPTRRAPPSWSSSSFWARRSNCRTSRGEPRVGISRGESDPCLWAGTEPPSWLHRGLAGAGD